MGSSIFGFLHHKGQNNIHVLHFIQKEAFFTLNEITAHLNLFYNNEPEATFSH